MTKEELGKEAEESSKEAFCIAHTHEDELIYRNGYLAGAEPREKRIAELQEQIEKLIDFVLSKTECCDICPITDTCINSEGTCPYAGILSKGEEAVTREWLMQKIAKEIKEK